MLTLTSIFGNLLNEGRAYYAADNRNTEPYLSTPEGRVRVASRFVVRGGRVRFALGRYDHSRPLVIDPSLAFGDYIGGTSVLRALVFGRQAGIHAARAARN